MWRGEVQDVFILRQEIKKDLREAATLSKSNVTRNDQLHHVPYKLWLLRKRWTIPIT